MTTKKILPPLGPLELEVMKIVWKKEECTVRDVVEDLNKEKSFAYTTIMTVMDHLHKKGLVKRVKAKKAYHYAPIVSEGLFIRSSIAKTFQNLTCEYGKLTVLASLIPLRFNFPAFKLNPTLSFYKTPVTIGFFTSLVLGLLTVSLWDFLQGLTFLGSVDYLKLVFWEPKIIFDHAIPFFSAFLESLPIISLTINLILFILAILMVKKITKLKIGGWL